MNENERSENAAFQFGHGALIFQCCLLLLGSNLDRTTELLPMAERARRSFDSGMAFGIIR